MAKKIEIIKKSHSKDRYTPGQYLELAKCMSNPLYFIENYMKIKHPTKGALPFKLYDFQRHVINSFHSHKDVILLTGRQMGKSITSNSIIIKNKTKIKIGSLINLNFKEKIIDSLEKLLIKIATY